MSKTVTPLRDNLLVVRKEPDAVSEGGIVIPSTARNYKQEFGVVVEVGEGLQNEDGTVLPIAGISRGDEIVFPGYAGQDFEVEGKKYLLVNSNDVMGVIHDG